MADIEIRIPGPIRAASLTPARGHLPDLRDFPDIRIHNPKGAVPVNDENPTPLERLGHLRAAIEDAEDHLLEGRLSAASERLSDAKGIGTFLTCRAEETAAALAGPPQTMIAEVAAPAQRLFTETELRAAVVRVTDRSGPHYIDRLLGELNSHQPVVDGPTDFPFKSHLAGIDLFEALSRVEALEEAGATLVRELAGKDPAWWVRAAGALGELERLAVDKDGA